MLHGLCTALVVIFLAVGAFADEKPQQKVLTADSGHWNVYTRASVAGNGSVLAFWSQHEPDTNDFATIKGVLCTRSAKGVYSFGAPVDLSTGEEYDDNPWAAWHAPSSSWLVVWHTNHDSPYIDVSWEIRARRIGADGRPVGPVFTVIEDGTRNVAPTLCPITTGSHAGRFLLCWVQKDRMGGHSSGLWSAIIDIDGAIHSGPNLILERPLRDTTYHPGLFEDVEANTDGSFLAGYSARREGEMTMDAFLVGLNANGTPRATFSIPGEGDRMNLRITRLKANTFIANWSVTDVALYGTLSRKFNAVAAPVGKVFDAFPTRKEYYLDTVKLGADKGALEVTIAGGNFYSRYLKKNGAPKGSERLIVSGAGAADEMYAYPIPASNQVFVIWRNRLSNVATDVRALVFQGK